MTDRTGEVQWMSDQNLARKVAELRAQIQIEFDKQERHEASVRRSISPIETPPPVRQDGISEETAWLIVILVAMVLIVACVLSVS